MTRKHAAAEGGESRPVRSSPRIAALPKPEEKPERQAPARQSKSRAKKNSSESADDVEILPVNDSPPRKRGRPSKKQIEENKSAVESTNADIVITDGELSVDTKEDAPSATDDFEIINKNNLPSPNSEEVKKAIEAQGPDGNLLVDVVQVTKNDVPAQNSEEIKAVTNQLEKSPVPCEANVKKPLVHEPEIKATVVKNGDCNGNCGKQMDDHDNENAAHVNGVNNNCSETNNTDDVAHQKQVSESTAVVDNAPLA